MFKWLKELFSSDNNVNENIVLGFMLSISAIVAGFVGSSEFVFFGFLGAALTCFGLKFIKP